MAQRRFETEAINELLATLSYYKSQYPNFDGVLEEYFNLSPADLPQTPFTTLERIASFMERIDPF